MTTPDPTPPMPDEPRCPQCGAPLVPGALAGLCPACLLKQGASLDTVTGAARPFEPPTVAELAPLFPQLEILDFIGQGGMGAVYKARQKELDRIVALKILPPALGDAPGFAERFSREAKALAKLNHPGILTIHEFGRADGLFYFLMEFVDGVNLRQLLAGGRISSREALAIVPEICDALQFAHDHGIVHRDIKPANILIDRRGRVKVADFGVAKLVESGMETGTTADRSPSDASLTEAGKVMGTPSYMAPEQTEHPGEVDHRADIYSLGVVLYELLTGELPAGKLELPSRKVRIDVRLDEVVLRTLEKRPDLRYQQASQVKAAVETITGAAAGGANPGAETAADAQSTLTREYALDIRSCFRRAWALVRSDFWRLVGVTALIFALLGVAGGPGRSDGNGSSQLASILFLLIQGPLMGGLYLYFLKKIRGEASGVETAFAGFSNRFLHLFLGSFVTLALTGLGFLCLILPGIYLLVAWTFTLPLIIDKGLHFWAAMELSRKVISRHWFHFFAFGLLLFLLSLAGLLALIVGFFLVAPIAIAALLYAYEDIFGSERVAATPPPPLAAADASTSPGAAARPATSFGLTNIVHNPVVRIVAAILLLSALIWGLTPHRSRKRSLGAAPGFAPLVERALTQEQITQGVALDLDTGTFVTASDLTFKPAADQFRAQHADVYFEPATGHWQALDMNIVSSPGHSFDVSPREVRQMRSKPVHGTSRIDPLPLNYLFRTREGNRGVLQIVNDSNEAGAVSVRYKMLQPAPKIVATESANAAGDQSAAISIPPTTQTRPAAIFASVLERQVNDIDENRGHECLVIESGDLLDFTGSHGLSKAEREKWFKERKINLLMDAVGQKRGIGVRDAAFTLLAADAWDHRSVAEIGTAINQENPGVEYKDVGGFRWHIIPAGAALPLTFAFRTASGRLGLLQVIRFGENPAHVKLRYKLVQAPAPSFFASWLQGDWAFDADYFKQQARAAATVATDPKQKTILEALSEAVFTQSEGMTWTISATEMQSNHPQNGMQKGPYRIVKMQDANTAEIEVTDEGKLKQMVFQKEGERLRLAAASPPAPDFPDVPAYYKRVGAPPLER